MKKKIGTVLRELRENSELSVPQVLEELKNRGYEISQSTFYSYENNNRAAGADMLLVLCEIYQCKDVLGKFSDVHIDYSIPTDEEWAIIEKYRSISESNPNGRELIDQTINLVYTQTVENNKSAKRTPPPRPNRCFGIWEHKRKHPYRHSGGDGVIVRFPIAN